MYKRNAQITEYWQKQNIHKRTNVLTFDFGVNSQSYRISIHAVQPWCMTKCFYFEGFHVVLPQLVIPYIDGKVVHRSEKKHTGLCWGAIHAARLGGGPQHASLISASQTVPHLKLFVAFWLSFTLCHFLDARGVLYLKHCRQVSKLDFYFRLCTRK